MAVYVFIGLLCVLTVLALADIVLVVLRRREQHGLEERQSMLRSVDVADHNQDDDDEEGGRGRGLGGHGHLMQGVVVRSDDPSLPSLSSWEARVKAAGGGGGGGGGAVDGGGAGGGGGDGGGGGGGGDQQAVQVAAHEGDRAAGVQLSDGGGDGDEGVGAAAATMPVGPVDGQQDVRQ